MHQKYKNIKKNPHASWVGTYGTLWITNILIGRPSS